MTAQTNRSDHRVAEAIEELDPILDTDDAICGFEMGRHRLDRFTNVVDQHTVFGAGRIEGRHHLSDFLEMDPKLRAEILRPGLGITLLEEVHADGNAVFLVIHDNPFRGFSRYILE